VRFATEFGAAPQRIRVSVQDQSAQSAALYPASAALGLHWAWIGIAVAALLMVACVAALLVFWRPRSAVAGRLAVVGGSRVGMVFELRPGRNRIGALDDNEIVLSSSRVSRYHAEVVASRRGAEIVDLGSKNGTWLNGKPIQRSPLRFGDRIALADVEIEYQR